MKKIYAEPEMEVLSFQTEDIVMASDDKFTGIFDNETEILGA